MLSQDMLKEIFEYREGNLYWRYSKRGGVKVGDKAGTLTTSRYYRVKLNKQEYYLHRLIYLYHHGYLPECIDHIDRDTTNNKIENLREATKAENCRNQKISKNNTTGVKGVSWFKRDNKWHAKIKVNKKDIHLGYYTNIEDAIKKIKEAREFYHKEFSYQGEL